MQEVDAQIANKKENKETTGARTKDTIIKAYRQTAQSGQNQHFPIQFLFGMHLAELFFHQGLTYSPHFHFTSSGGILKAKALR